jgi:hypothetical protein
LPTKTPSKPTTAKSKSVEVWAEIPPKAKPSKAVSKETLREALTCAYIEHRGDEVFLCATDSYVCIELPVKLDCAKKDRKKLLPEVGLIPHALKALDRSSTGRFRIKDGLVQIDGEPMLYPVRTDLTPPNFKELWPEEYGSKDNDGVKAIAFNPHKLHQVGEALGVTKQGFRHAVKVEFIGPLRPILVTPSMTDDGRAMVMPVRMREG